jgi:hypothetical protein
MIAALFGKEWIKARWWLLLATAVTVFTLGKLFLAVRESFEFNDANALLNAVVHRKLVFYDGIRFNAIVAGLLLAAAQFLPEVRGRRLRLLFHLPLPHDLSLAVMVAAGLAGTGLVVALNLMGLVVILAPRYPGDVVASAVVTSLPWLLAGFAAYGGAALVLLEPTWWRKIAFGAMAYALLDLYFLGGPYEAYAPSLPQFAIVAALLPWTVFLPAFRVKRGRR